MAAETLEKRRLRVLITSGPTREPLDPVRYISNYSTGTMGAALASEALRRGHKVTVITGPGHRPLPEGAKSLAVERAAEMAAALYAHAPQADIVIMAAAVADYRAAEESAAKIKRGKTRNIKLVANPDIIAAMARTPGQVVVGFALETEKAPEAGLRKLRRKKLDLLLAQSAAGGSPFGDSKLRAWLVEAPGAIADMGIVTKARAACVLLDKSEALWYRHHGRVSPKANDGGPRSPRGAKGFGGA